VGEAYGLEFLLGLSAKGEDLLHEGLARELALSTDPGSSEATHLAGFELRHFSVADDRRQNIVEVVCNTAARSDGLHFLRLRRSFSSLISW